jgi:hypothetical protein
VRDGAVAGLAPSTEPGRESIVQGRELPFRRPFLENCVARSAPTTPGIPECGFHNAFDVVGLVRRNDEMAASLAQHVLAFAAGVHEGKDRPARAQIFVQLVRHLKRLILGEEQEQIRVRDAAQAFIVGDPATQHDAVRDGVLVEHSGQWQTFVRFAIADELDADACRQSILPMQVAERAEERTRVAPVIEVSDVE